MLRLALVTLLLVGVARADNLPATNSTMGAGVGGGTSCTTSPGSGANPSPMCGLGRAPIVTLRGANFNVTTDQALAIPAKITAYHVERIVVTNCSTSLTLAVGGFYTAASKGGTAIVSAAQVYSALTSAAVGLEPTLVAAALSGGASYRLTASNIYLSLTVAQGGAATCDVYLFGDDLT